MAVTESLLVEVSLDTKDYSRSISRVVKDTKTFKDSTDKSSASNEYLETTLRNLNDTIKILEKSVNRFSQVTAQAYKNYAIDVDKSTLSLAEFNNEILKNNENISKNSESLVSIDKNVSKYGQTLEETSLAMRVFEGALQVATIAAGAFGINKLGQNFKIYRDNVNPVINDTIKLGKSWGFAEDLLTAKMTPSLIRFSELLWSFSKPIALVSGLMLSLDNSFLNLIGTIGLLVAGVGASFGAFFTILINSSANLATAIGEGLLNSLTEAELKFEKFQSTMNQFTFTIQGFGKSLGVDAVGSVDHWLNVLNDLRKNTTFSTEDIAKSIKFLVAEGSRFGLTVTQIEELIKRTADVSSAYGENIVDTSMKMNAAFAGSSQALQNMGFAVSDAYFSHSDFFLALGKTTEQMTKQEIAATRLDLIMKETAAIAGAAANSTTTLAGSSAILNRTMNDLQSSLGETSGFLTKLQSVVISNISSLIDYAKPILSLVGTLQEWLGIGLIITGFLLKQFFYLTFYTQLWVFLNNVLKTNLTVQKLLDVAFLKLSKTMNFSATSVVNMTTLFKNLGGLLKSVALSTFASLTVGIKIFTAYVLSATAAVFKFTLSLMTNPLFIKGAVIVGSLIVLANAIKETINEIEFLKNVFEDTSQAAVEAGGNFVDAGANMAKAFGSTIMTPLKKIFNTLVDISKFILGGLVAAVLVFAASFAYINRAVRFMANGFKESAEDAAAFDAQIEEIALKLGQTSYFIRKTGTEIEKTFGGVALGAPLAQSVEEVEAKTKKAQATLEKYVNLHMVGFDAAKEKSAELGSEYDRLTLNLNKSKIALEQSYKTNLDLNEKSKKIAEARIELIKAEIAIEKQRQATINEIESQRQSVAIDLLKRSGQGIKAINTEYEAKIDKIRKEENELKKINKLRLEDQIIINQSISLIKKSQAQAVSDEVIKGNEKLLQLKNNLIEIEKEITKESQGEINSVIQRTAERAKEIDLETQRLRLQGSLTKEAKEILRLTKEANQEAAKAKIDKVRLDTAKELNKTNADLEKQLIGLTGLEQEIIDAQLKSELAIIAAKKEQLYLENAITKMGPPSAKEQEILKALQKEQKIREQIASIQKEKAAPREFEAAKKIGTDIAGSVTQVFQSGAAGMAMGAMAGVSAVVDAIQALIDFIPGILDKVSNVFNSLTELPNKIVAGLANVFDSILKFVSDFIPNLLRMIPAIFEKFTSFFEKLPELFANLLTNLPDMLSGILDRLPEVVENFVEKFIKAIPKIAIALAKFLIMEGPRIALELAKSLAIEIPLAIIKGVLDAFKSLPGMFKNLGKGILPKPAEIAKNFALGLKAVSKNLTGVASKLFAVMDLEDGAKASGDRVAEFAKTAQNAVDEGVKKLGNSWQGLIDAWKFIYDNFISPIIQALTAIWRWVWDTIFMPFIGFLKDVGGAVAEIWRAAFDFGANILEGVVSIWHDAWKMFESIGSAFVNFFRDTWNVLMDLFSGKINLLEAVGRIWENILNLGGATLQAVAIFFDGVFKTAANLLMSFATMFQSVGQTIYNLLNPLVDRLVNFLAGFGTFLSDFGKAVINAGGQIFEGFASLLRVFDFGGIGGKIWNGLKGGLDQIGGLISNQLNGINPANLFSKMFDTSGAKGQGTVESKLGIDIPFLNFAKGGMVPGTGSVPNDSRINDRIVALLSAGEAIIPKSKMDDPAVAGIVQGILSGKIGAPAYAVGGVVKAVKNFGGEVSGAFQQAVEPLAEVLDPAKILEQAWASMKGMVWDRVLDMFWSMLEQNKFHDGGLVPGSGDIPTMLKGGEFVLNKSAASSIGVPTLNDLNAGKAPSNNTQNIELNLVINTSQPIDATMIKNKIMPVIREELKRASIDGRTTIYQSGVRTA